MTAPGLPMDDEDDEAPSGPFDRFTRVLASIGDLHRVSSIRAPGDRASTAFEDSFLALTLRVRDAFDAHPGLRALTLVFQQSVQWCDDGAGGLRLALRPQLSLLAAGAPALAAEADDWLARSLPYWAMADGSVRLVRGDPLLHELLSAAVDSGEELRAAMALSQQIGLTFGDLQFQWLGWEVPPS